LNVEASNQCPTACHEAGSLASSKASGVNQAYHALVEKHPAHVSLLGELHELWQSPQCAGAWVLTDEVIALQKLVEANLRHEPCKSYAYLV
jgi:hypothetical protein